MHRKIVIRSRAGSELPLCFYTNNITVKLPVNRSAPSKWTQFYDKFLMSKK